MANSRGDKKIGWYISWFLCLLCSVAVFLPAVNVADIFGMSEAESYSLSWYLKEAGFPEVYTVILTVYYAAVAVVGAFGFKKELSVWPLVGMAVVSVLFFAVNLFWGYVIMTGTGGFEGAVTLTLWSWIYLALQPITIVTLFVFISKMKQ